ncbi:SusC/RagA family TonB-linked outer membrane protein [Flavobacterium sp. RSP29]|uniref:SusC/RagA family TonB-linked outer membrane protein n=1 Tax=Flavobacterium sp. RSP29 TaxID=3401731 RepID=UPI003AB0D5C6
MKTIYKKLLMLLLLLPFSILAQNTVGGTVLDKMSGQPIPGVNVNVQGAANGVSTDFDGKYQLSNVKRGDKIVFSYIGYMDTVVGYVAQNSLNVSLQEDANQLQEVIIQVGYGTVKKKDATGAVTVLTAEDFNKGPVTSADQMIQGKVAGLQIINGGGSPGEGATIRIRSGSSLSANNDPLYVIDGVPVAAGGITGGRNPLTTINQNNIESISVLKDASATAIYGSRASNGVIIITTKRGKAGEMKVNYNGNFQVSEIVDKVDALTSTQFRAFVNANGTPAQQALMGTADTDWQKEIFRTAIGTDHNIALSGGMDNIVYRASVGYTNLNGILKRDNLERSTLGVNVTGNFLDNHLKIEVNNNTSLLKNNYSNRGAIGAAISYDPTQRITRASDGNYYEWYSINNGKEELNQLAGRNPLSLIEQQNNYGTSYRSIGNIQTEYKLHFLPELKAVANFGYDELRGRSYGDTDAKYLNAVPGSGFNNTYENTNSRFNKLMDLYLNYNKKVESINTVFDVTGGYSYQDFRDTNGGSSYNFENKTTVDVVSFPSRVNLQSFFARTNISIADKYLLTLSYRRDGTSRFTESNRWANFPAVAVAWKVNEENFLKDVASVSTLKIRGGWGVTGQQDIGVSYPSIPLYLVSNSAAQYQFGNTFYNTFRPQPYNSNLKWEETTTANVGLDYGFLNNRINGSVDLYQRTTKDLLLYTQNPSFFGFSNFDNYNIGTIENKGIELAAEVVPFKTDNFEWSLGGNITFQDSKITKLTTVLDNTPGINVGGYAGATGNTIQNHQVGYSPNSYYVYEQAYGADAKPIDGVYIDRNQDGLITEQDKYRFHKPAADVFYGLNTSVVYKNFDMAMTWRGSWGNYNYNNVDSSKGSYQNILIRETDLSNGVANLLETGFTSQDTKRFESDYYIQDASFIRLDNVSVGYTFNQKANATSLVKLTLAAQNVLLFTDYTGIDPEISGGIDNNLYPRPITFTLGLNVNF